MVSTQNGKGNDFGDPEANVSIESSEKKEESQTQDTSKVNFLVTLNQAPLAEGNENLVALLKAYDENQVYTINDSGGIYQVPGNQNSIGIYGICPAGTMLNEVRKYYQPTGNSCFGTMHNRCLEILPHTDVHYAVSCYEAPCLASIFDVFVAKMISKLTKRANNVPEVLHNVFKDSL